MKKNILILFAGILLFSCQENSSADSNRDKYAPNPNLEKPTEFNDRMSYAFGYDLNRGLSFLDSNQRKINFEYLIRGLYDGMKDTNIFLGGSENKIALMTLQERQDFVKELQRIQVQYQREAEIRDKEAFAKRGDKLLTQGIDYLNENQKKPGWKVSETGLQYKPITVTEGPKPTDDLVIEANIIGHLTDGTEFDNTYTRGKPLILPVDGMNKGFKEAIKMMSPGSKYEFVIPSQLAYADKGAGTAVPPNAVLIVEVQLEKILGTKEEYKKQKMSLNPESSNTQSEKPGQPKIKIERKK